MLCENCKVNNATTHIKKTVNGVTNEYFLCPECAAKLGFNNFNFFKLDNFWNDFLGEPVIKSLKRCETCNSSFEDIVNNGKMGCADCYSIFKDEILPTIKKIHGKTIHTGATPSYTIEEEKEDNKIEALENKLQEAIKNEEFEKAAEIRDELKELRKKENE